MAARAIWKAELHLGSVRLPVKLYTAVRETTVHFRLLHAKDHAPVTQVMIDPVDERVVPKEEIRKGLELEEGTFVVLNQKDQKALEPEPSRDIQVEQVVPRTEIDLRWFERPYYLGPDEGDAADYFALAEALEKEELFGVARWVMRKKHYQGALFGKDGYLVLNTLRHVGEIVDVERVAPQGKRAPDRRELALAEQLIATLEDRFDPSIYRDEYRQRLMELIEAKAKGRVIRLRKPKPPPRGKSLAQQLAASLNGGRKVAHGRRS